MREIDEIIIHCSATRDGWMDQTNAAAKVVAIRKWHVEDRGWRDIGYNIIIDRDGKIENGRDLDKDGDSFEHVGAHVKGHNSHSIGVCLIGGHGSSATDKFSDHFTPAQNLKLRYLIDNLKKQFPSITKISGHNEYANKACPGFNVAEWLGKKKPRTSVAQSSTMQASAAQIASGVAVAGGAVSSLSGTAQVVAIVLGALIVLAGGWIMRERIKKWAKGDR